MKILKAFDGSKATCEICHTGTIDMAGAWGQDFKKDTFMCEPCAIKLDLERSLDKNKKG